MPLRRVALVALAGIISTACSSASPTPSNSPTANPGAGTTSPTATAAATPASPTLAPTPTPPPVGGIYAATVSGTLDSRIANLQPRVYVPNEQSGDVTVIDPKTFKIIGRFNTR